MHLAHLLRVEHGARADQRVRKALAHQRDALHWLRRIERHFEQPEAGLDDGVAHVGGFGGREAAQDGHERQGLHRGVEFIEGRGHGAGVLSVSRKPDSVCSPAQVASAPSVRVATPVARRARV
ncbi:hypothetical protein FQZ97_803020 [compost metagenome]